MATLEHTGSRVACFHCGLDCPELPETADGHAFCCAGCQAVYLILQDARLGTYYSRDESPGQRPTLGDKSRFAYLDSPEIVDSLLEYTDALRRRITLHIPAIHCASCVWLLENLHRLNPAILRSVTNLSTRRVTILYDRTQASIRVIVELLARIGYEPDIRLDSLGERTCRSTSWQLYAKIGVAGFAFANVMLFSLPEYLSKHGLGEGGISTTFRLASLILALPVLLYSAQDYFRSAWAGLKARRVNLDVPLALGIGSLFLRSAYDVLSGSGPGYFDSFTGLVFFLLAGRVFQQKSFEWLSFDRDYRAYFPLSCLRRERGCDLAVPITRLKPGDRIVVRHQELVPADAILISGQGRIDYSFITGEADLQDVESGVRVYAGGRQVGEAIELEVLREVSQSRLVSLWSSPAMVREAGAAVPTVADAAGRYFTLAVLLIAVATALFWYWADPSRMIWIVTSVLIVACPCALALSRPFALGTLVRIWGRQRLYVRGIEIADAMARIDDVVFDKTGTLTQAPQASVSFVGPAPSEYDKQLIGSLARHSTHPLSRQLSAVLESSRLLPVSEFKDVAGQGVSGVVDGHTVHLGNRDWAWFGEGDDGMSKSDRNSQVVYVGFDCRPRGFYLLGAVYRERLEDTISRLRRDYRVSVLTGDNARDAERLKATLGEGVSIAYEQSPHNKLDHVAALQTEGRNVMMVGDGLNDAGALHVATVGIAVTEDTSAFSPSSDGILDATRLPLLPQFLGTARRVRRVVYASFAVSLLYNVVGLSFAVTGHLSPLVSAILMPVSSVSVVLFASLGARLAARREKSA